MQFVMIMVIMCNVYDLSTENEEINYELCLMHSYIYKSIISHNYRMSKIYEGFFQISFSCMQNAIKIWLKLKERKWNSLFVPTCSKEQTRFVCNMELLGQLYKQVTHNKPIPHSWIINILCEPIRELLTSVYHYLSSNTYIQDCYMKYILISFFQDHYMKHIIIFFISKPFSGLIIRVLTSCSTGSL